MNKILIVDDAPENIKIVGELLKGKYGVLVANNGSKAVQIATAYLPDLILMDVMMPEMDGYSACIILKNNELTKDIPIIFITALNETADVIKGFEVGGADYVTKPFNPKELYARIRTHIELKESGKAIKRYAKQLEDNNQELVKTMVELKESRDSIKNIMDNTGEGFLCFGRDLMVKGDYSRECMDIFNGEIKSRNVDELIFDDNYEEREKFKEVLTLLLNSTDALREELYLSILSDFYNEMKVNGKIISIKYKLITRTENGVREIMTILEDVTEKKNLEEKICVEQHKLKAVVKAVVYKDELVKLLDDFKEFVSLGVMEMACKYDEQSLVLELFLIVHTFKGNFAQLDMRYISETLNELENELGSIKKNKVGREILKELFSRFNFEEALERDIHIIRETLGENYFDDKNLVKVDKKRLVKIENLIRSLEDQRKGTILNEFRKLRYKSLKEMLNIYSEYVERISVELEKSINRLHIYGDDVFLDAERYYEFTKSLVHVFRNIVDHGIEMPEDRLLQSKSEKGSIKCLIVKKTENIEIVIEDDGQGISVEKIKSKIFEKGLLSNEQLDKLQKEDIIPFIFENGISTKDIADKLSGRGVGLAAVKRQIDDIGGTIHVESVTGEGTKFKFILPVYENDTEFLSKEES